MRPRERWTAIVTFAIGVVVLSLASVVVVADRQTVTTVDDAVAAFRADQPLESSPAPEEPTSSSAPGDPAAATGTPSPQPSAPTEASTASTGGGTGDAAAPPQDASVQSEPRDDRAATAPATASPAPVEARSRLAAPEEGVYTYATEGGESIDALGGARHDYPDETTITVRHTDCGFTSRWEPLRERWEEYDSCQDGSRAWMRTITLYHEFFGRGVRHEYACDDTATLADVSAEPGQRWSWDCHSDGGSMHTVVEIVEFGTRDVGGQPVDAVHVRIHNTMDGDTRGARKADVWFDRSSRLELHGTYETDTAVDTPMGTTRYVERFSRTLIDLRPRR